MSEQTYTDTYTDIAVTLDKHVATVEIQRPPNNFFDLSLIRQIADAFDTLDADAECRAEKTRLAELSSWNEDTLRIELADLAELQLDGALDFDLTITGFDMPEIDLIIGGVSEDMSAAPETED